MGIEASSTAGDSPAANRAQRQRRHRLVASLPLVLLVVAGALTASTALFSDTAVVEGNTIATGSLDLTSSPTTAAFDVPAMTPGDVEFASIVLTNSGSVDVRHSMTSTATADPAGLTEALALGVAVPADGSGCRSQQDFDAGDRLYGGRLASSAGLAVYGDPTPGSQGGERILGGGRDEVLCLRVELASSMDPALQGSRARVAFRFDAEQTANNP